MRHLFYFIIILPILWEMSCISNPKKITKFRKTYKGLQWSEYSNEQKNLVLLQMGYFIWNFIGLFTFQWPAFLLIALLGMTIPKKHYIGTFIDGFLTLIILLFILINNYHLHINISHFWKLILN